MRIINASYFSEERTEPISYDEPIISQQNKILQVRRFLATSVILLKRKLHLSSSAFYNQLVQKKSIWVFKLRFLQFRFKKPTSLTLSMLEITSLYLTRVWPIEGGSYLSGGLLLISSILIDLDLCWVYIGFTICKRTLAISSQFWKLKYWLRRYRELRLVTPIEWWFAIVYQGTRCIIIRERVTTSPYYHF